MDLDELDCREGSRGATSLHVMVLSAVLVAVIVCAYLLLATDVVSELGVASGELGGSQLTGMVEGSEDGVGSHQISSGGSSRHELMIGSKRQDVMIQVLSSATGQPLRALVVGRLGTWVTGYEDGKAAIQIRAGDQAAIMCKSPGYHPMEVNLKGPTAVVRLVPRTILVCRVVDSVGIPVRDAEVVAGLSNGLAAVLGRTQEDGTLSVPLEKKRYLFARKGDKVSAVNLGIGAQAVLELKLSRLDGRSLGLRSRGSRAGVRGARICLQGLGRLSGFRIDVITGAEGLVLKPIPRGLYTAKAFGAGLVQADTIHDGSVEIAPGTVTWIEVEQEAVTVLRVLGADFIEQRVVEGFIEVVTNDNGVLNRVQFLTQKLKVLSRDRIDLTPVVVAVSKIPDFSMSSHVFALRIPSYGVIRFPSLLHSAVRVPEVTVRLREDDQRWLRIVDDRGQGVQARIRLRLKDLQIGSDEFVGTSRRDGWVGPVYWSGGDWELLWGEGGVDRFIATIHESELRQSVRIQKVVTASGIVVHVGSDLILQEALLSLHCWDKSDRFHKTSAIYRSPSSVFFPILRSGVYSLGIDGIERTEIKVELDHLSEIQWDARWSAPGEVRGTIQIAGHRSFAGLAVVPVFRGSGRFDLSPDMPIVPVSTDGSFLLKREAFVEGRPPEGLLVIRDLGHGIWIPLAYEEGCPSVVKVDASSLSLVCTPQVNKGDSLALEVLIGGFRGQHSIDLGPGLSRDLGLWPLEHLTAWKQSKNRKTEVLVPTAKQRAVLLVR